MDKIIKVLVVDDSAYVRKVIKEMLSRSPFIEVVGVANNGKEALAMVEELNPDVVTLDLMMPEMDGVEFLQEQRKRKPVAVVVVSVASEADPKVLAALDALAIDFVQKPTALATEKIFEVGEELIEKVKAAAQVPLKNLPTVTENIKPQPIKAPPRAEKIDMVVLGISTGGPQALNLIIPQLPSDFPVPLALVLHMPVGYTQLFAERLNNISAVEVREAKEGELLKPGLVFVAPAGQHLLLSRQSDGSIVTTLDPRTLDCLHRPSVDILFQSAAEVYKNRLLGVIMTGMGSDGQKGAAWIKSQGGMIFTEAESTCVVYGMPRSVDEAGLSDKSIPLDQIVPEIIKAL